MSCSEARSLHRIKLKKYEIYWKALRSKINQEGYVEGRVLLRSPPHPLVNDKLTPIWPLSEQASIYMYKAKLNNKEYIYIV